MAVKLKKPNKAGVGPVAPWRLHRRGTPLHVWIPTDVHEALLKAAKAEHQSITSRVILALKANLTAAEETL